jgi:putative membrane protein
VEEALGQSLQAALAECHAAALEQAQSWPVIAAKLLVGAVLLIHVYFALLETLLFRTRGVKVFRLTPERAEILAPLMSNQGIYNLFLVLALGLGLALPIGETSRLFVFYGLVCVVIAGAWGAFTVRRTIFFVQALPALIALPVYIWATYPVCWFSHGPAF